MGSAEEKYGKMETRHVSVEFGVTVSPKVSIAGHILVPRKMYNAKKGRINMLGKYPCVILVHQWSKLGGMESLMAGIASGLVANQLPCVTFNLRGVGGSTGSATWTCTDEVSDVVAVVHYIEENLGANNIYLVGSSAGAPLAGSAVDCSPSVKAYVGIGYTFGWWASIVFKRHYDSILKTAKPKLLITGSRDGFTPMRSFNHYFDRMEEPKRKYVVEGVGHFKLESPEYDGLMIQQIMRFITEFSPQPWIFPKRQTGKLRRDEKGLILPSERPMTPKQSETASGLHL
eukprot:Selendium_serpulae@DN5942_c0_g1_i3.p1